MDKKAKLKKALPERRFGVILESMDSKLDLIVEGHKILDGKIDKVDQKVDILKKEMDYKFDVVFDELRIIRNELKEKIGRDEFVLLEKRVARLEKVNHTNK